LKKDEFSIFSLLNQPINQVVDVEKEEKFNVTDSFEANLLKQLKAEMDEVPKKKTINKSKNSPEIFDNSNHSNENTSDKIYNYQVMTNSFETESTTSVCPIGIGK
jgi:hypothetical protein